MNFVFAPEAPCTGHLVAMHSETAVKPIRNSFSTLTGDTNFRIVINDCHIQLAK